MRTKKMLFENLRLLVAVLFLLAYIKLVASGGYGDNGTVKVIRCRDNERRALLDFKEALVDEYGILSSWGKSQEEDCCKWRGIHCSNRTGHVTALDVNSYIEFVTYKELVTYGWAHLRGKVSPSLLELNHLKYLDLSYNEFEGPIPEFFGSLGRLQHLNLTLSNFAGKIPHQLGNLTNLRSLDLGYNDFRPVENLKCLSHLRLLNYLNIGGVDLENCSDWLQQIHKLSFLSELNLFDCNLPGTAQSSLLPLNNSSSSSSSSLIHLTVVDLSMNKFNSLSSYNWLFNSSSSLVYVNLFNNSLSGSIPEAFGSMGSLEYLNLISCQLEGELPKSFRNLSRLDRLYLDNNNFNGTLSAFIRPLAANEKNSLGVLSLSENQLSGSLPDFTKFPSLRVLDLDFNQLCGSLPDFTRFSSLTEMVIRENKLNGSFPEKFGQVTGLVVLDLSLNQITGSFPNLTLFPSLEELYLFENQLEDTIPEAYFSNLDKLKILDLSFNSLTMKFSIDWVPPFQLDSIILQRCNLGPHFPNWLQSQRNFSVLDISGNGISDPIPLWFWDLSPRLSYLNLSYNEIQGMLPYSPLEFDDSVTIDLSSNRLMGPIRSLHPNISVLLLSQNMFTGSVSFLCTTAYAFLFYLDLSDNQLSGQLPDCWMNVNQLDILNLANNNFAGKFPTSVGLLNNLQILQLRNNNFMGEFPSSLLNCSDLLVLDLSENELSGEVPTWIGTHLTSLIVLSLRENEFFGNLPPSICHLREAQVLDLSQNIISGSIPVCINNLTSLVQRDSDKFDIVFMREPYGGLYVADALVQWKGRESKYKNTLPFLKLIDLSSNRLVGEIPQELASLEELISLNLSSNNLTGNIIQKIGQMKMLEVLDLSRNQLSGEIPIGLANLTFLSVLDLSNNNFTGKIPSSTQLQSFNASVYAGNDKLCGLPLPHTCSDDEPPFVGHGKDENNEEGDDRFVKVGFYVSVVLGFVTGFWGFLGPILLRSTWRHAYFRLLGKIKDWIYVSTAINVARLQRKIYG